MPVSMIPIFTPAPALALPPTALHAAGTPTRLTAAFSKGVTGGNFGIMFIAESAVPDCSVNHKQADGVVIVALLQVPSIPRMIGGNPQKMALQQFVIDLISVLLQKRECANVK